MVNLEYIKSQQIAFSKTAEYNYPPCKQLKFLFREYWRMLVHFAVIGLDGTDENALSRRMAAREAHLKLAQTLSDEKHLLHACALLDDAEAMMGSIMIVDFNTREDLDNWLKIEPYMIGKVWEKLEIRPCKVSPKFLQ